VYQCNDSLAAIITAPIAIALNLNRNNTSSYVSVNTVGFRHRLSVDYDHTRRQRWLEWVGFLSDVFETCRRINNRSHGEL